MGSRGAALAHAPTLSDPRARMSDHHTTRSFVAGGAGFIGSHLTHELLRRPDHEVVVFDNFVSGSIAHLDDVIDDPRLQLIEADLRESERVVAGMHGADHVYLFAANADIAAAVTIQGSISGTARV